MGGDNPQASLPSGVANQSPQQSSQSYTPSFNSAYSKYMPQEYFGNSPVYDPSAILNAYRSYLPQFQQALQSSNNPNGPTTNNTPKALPTGGGGGGKGPMDYLDPIGSAFFGLF